MRSVRNKAAAGAFAAILAAGAFAAPSVEITNVQQQYPWTNTVDITYTVQGVNKTHQTNRLDHIVNDTYFATFEAKSGSTPIADVNGNTIFTNGLVQGNGTFTAQWHPAMDQQLTGCTMTPSVFRGEENAYLVIDLETNKQGKCDWWYEPMSTQEESNKRYNTTEYKTKKLVFRRIPAGTYTIGSTSYNCYGNSAHQVKFPTDYFMLVFPLTSAQYARLTANSTSTDEHFISSISWSVMRGSALRTAVAGTGPLATISERTGLLIDLPTHAMVEVSHRARSITHWLDGTAQNNYKYSRCASASNNAVNTQTPGLYKPNAWGLYDMMTGHVMFIDSWQSGTASLEVALENNFMPVNQNNTNFSCTDCLFTYGISDNRTSPSSIWGQAITQANSHQMYRLAIYPEGYYPNGGKK